MVNMTVAQEAIQFQAASPLFKDLTAAIADLQNLVPFNKTDTYNQRTIAYDRAYNKLKIKQRLIDIVQKHLNLSIRVLYEPYNGMSMISVLCFGKTPDYKNAYEYVWKRWSGQRTDEHFARPSIILEQRLQAISNAVSPDTGQVIRDLNGMFFGELGFDVYYLSNTEIFLGQRVQPENLAACLIHELGHVVGEMMHIWQISHCSELADDVISYVENKLDVDDVEPCLKVCLQALSNNTNDTGATKATEAIHGVLIGLKNRTLNDKDCLELTKLLCKTTTSLCTTRSTIGAFKDSDLLSTSRHTSLVERMCDQFVSRHGAGAALAQYLAIVTKMDETTDVYGDLRTNLARTALDNVTTSVKLTYAFMRFKASFKTSPCCTGDIYDPIVMRMESAVNDAYIAFKNTKIDDASRDYFIDVIKQGHVVIEEYKDQSYVKTRQALFNFFERLKWFKQTTLLVMFSTLIKDYTALQMFTEDLIKTPLFYQAARVDQVLHPTKPST